MNWLKDSLTLLFTAVAVMSLLALLAAASATTVRTGWQIHVFYAGSDRKVTIGPPFPTKQLCEEIRFPVMIEMIGDRVECVPVVDRYNVD